MKHRDHEETLVKTADVGSTFPPSAPAPKTKPPKRHRVLRFFGWTFLVLALVLGVVRAIMPWSVERYVNKTLSKNPLYSGQIGTVHIHLWRGAYSIEQIKIDKTTGNVPVPFFAASNLDLSIQWNALLHGRIVGEITAEQPVINFVDAPSDDDSQTGGTGPWLEMIRDLFPFQINRFRVVGGAVHFRTYQTAKPVDVYLSNLEATIDNLGNISDQSSPLSATVKATATAMDEAKLNVEMTLDPFSYKPTFHVAVRMLNLDLTKINDLALAYGKFDFKRGWFDLVLETDAKEGQITGYIKPLFRNLQVFSLAQDLKEDNVLQFFWQALVGATTKALRNIPRDQFGTMIPFTAEADGPTSIKLLTTLGNIFRNAFVRAYLPRLDQLNTNDSLKFSAPDFTDAISTSNGN